MEDNTTTDQREEAMRPQNRLLIYPHSPEANRTKEGLNRISAKGEALGTSEISTVQTTFTLQPNIHADGVPWAVPGVGNESTAWDVYNNEAKKVDAELIKVWKESLISLLLFSGIFAAVLTPFIVETKRLLEEDPAAITLDAQLHFMEDLANGYHRPYAKIPFTPSQDAIMTNSILFASLGASLLAAFGSVVALQWVAEYDAAVTRSGASAIDEAKRRQLLFDGIIRWRMKDIIATLPLLLYCAVLIFFAGAVKWILAINPTVGKVLAVAAAAAAAFYFISTILAVCFVTAPFRTPLSRGAHGIVRILIHLFHPLVVFFTTNLPTWAKEQADFTNNIRKRYGQVADNNQTLAHGALLWLARELNLTPHLHRQFLLLLQEVSKLPITQFQSLEMKEAPWSAIYDLVGSKYLKALGSGEITGEDSQIIAWLAQNASNPDIGAIIAPEGSDYQFDYMHPKYWEQYQRISTSSGESKVPNSTFLITRDAPVAVSSSAADVETMIRFMRWRNFNSEPATAFWWDSFANNKAYSSAFFNSLVACFVRYANSTCALPKTPYTPSMGLHDILDLVTQNDLNRCLSLDTTVRIFRVFEKITVLDSQIATLDFEVHGGLLQTPHLYAAALRQINDKMRPVHDRFLLLLARAIFEFTQKKFEDQPSKDVIDGITRNAKEILAMIWMREQKMENALNWANSKPRSGWIDHLWKSNRMLWTTGLHSLPQVFEILNYINRIWALLQCGEPLWRFQHQTELKLGDFPDWQEIFYKRRKKELNILWNQQLVVNSALEFGRLLDDASQPADHLTVITTLHRDLEATRLPMILKSGFTITLRERLLEIADPCLRIMACWAVDAPFAHKGSFSQDYFHRYKKSWALAVSYISHGFKADDVDASRHFRPDFLPILPFKHSQLLAIESLMDLDSLCEMEHIFDYPKMDDEDIIKQRQIRLLMFFWRYGGQDAKYTPEQSSSGLVVDLAGRYVSLLLLILLSSVRGTRSAFMDGFWHQTCLARIRGICDRITADYPSYLAILNGIICTRQAGNHYWRAEDLVVLVALVERVTLSNETHGPPRLLNELMHGLERLSWRYGKPTGEGVEEQSVVAEHISRLVHTLRNKSRHILWSNSQCRLITCIDEGPNQPAMEWTPRYGWPMQHGPPTMRSSNDEMAQSLNIERSDTKFWHETTTGANSNMIRFYLRPEYPAPSYNEHDVSEKSVFKSIRAFDPTPEFPTSAHLYHSISRKFHHKYRLPLKIITKIFGLAAICKTRPVYVARAPREVKLVAGMITGNKVYEDIFLCTFPLSKQLLASIGKIQLHTTSHDQGWVSDKNTKSWSWFEIRVLSPCDETDSPLAEEVVVIPSGMGSATARRRYRTKRVTNNERYSGKGGWESHFNTCAGEQPEDLIGEEYTREHDLFTALEEGDVLSVYACVCFNRWENNAERGELLFWEVFDPSALGRQDACT